MGSKMRSCIISLALFLASGCGSSWQGNDEDGDGYTILQGDCFDAPGGEGVGPGATEVWYDGLDQNCDGNDGDQDGDGEPAIEAGGADCWDDPTQIPDAFLVLNGFVQPEAAEVKPGQADVWYDGIDQNCGGEDDFDQDGDGYASTAWAETRTSLPVEDCYDAETESYPTNVEWCNGGEVSTPLSPAQVNPDAEDQIYDGTDANCDQVDDFDGDGDSYPSCEDCDDTDPLIFPNDTPEIWYNGVDENCDRNDADQDGDLFLDAGYSEPATPIHDMAYYGEGDCWDDPSSIPAEYVTLRGAQPEAEDVHPEASEVWYDGVDQDCKSDDDFDQDQDGTATDQYGNRSGLYGEDCNDEDGAINPDAADAWYDGVDSDCAGNSDYDQDGDGYESSDYSAGSADDCDDTKPGVHPDVNEDCATTYDDDCDADTNDDDADACVEHYDDADADGYGDINDSRCLCEPDGTYTETGVTSSNDDCDDTRSAVSPGAANESCSTTYDDDCDGVTNEQNGTSCTTYYLDADGDGYGTTSSQCWCSGYGTYDVTNDDDCDDSRAAVSPAVTKESCATTYDDDCDGVTNEEDATSCTTYYYDGDGDGYGTTASECWCAGTGSYDVTVNTDCDDAEADTFPGAASSDSTTSCMNDDDGDNYGDTSVSGSVVAGTDCDDSRSTVKPTATETCGTTYDDDCDGSTNDTGAVGCTTYYYDGDNDTYGKSSLSQCTCTTSGSYDVTNSTDCDDSDADTFPGAASSDSTTSCMNDDDGDNYGDDDVASGVTAGTDCDDTLAAVKPTATETCSTTYDDDCDSSSNDVGATGCTTYYYDGDGDGYGITTSQCTCTTSGAYDVTNDDDCDDSRAAVYPGRSELCTTTYDDDCDGSSNDVGATGCTTYYYDGDADGYGITTASQCTCTSSGLYTVTSVTSANDDCDDTLATVSPGDAETCSTTYDDDCDSDTNDVNATGCTTYYYDADNDGYGLLTTTQCTCSASGSYDVTGTTAANDDCDDTLAAVNPAATETCSTTYDDDCDSSANDVGATGCTTYYYDADGDGYGLLTTTQCTCTASGDYDVTGVTAANDDCDDSRSAVSPAGTETCSTTYDDDCDGGTNDVNATGCTTYYYDGDGDGYGLLTTTQCTCTASGDYDVSGTTASNDDCDDADSAVNPAAADTFAANDGEDNDCDGYIDETGAAAGDVIVSEFLGGAALGSGYDWVELYNTSSTKTVYLSAWTLSFCTDDDGSCVADGSGGEVVVTFPTSAEIAPNAYYVVCSSPAVWDPSANCDLRLTDYDSPAFGTNEQLGANNGGFVLELSSTLIDEVEYWTDGAGSGNGTGGDDWPLSVTLSTQLDHTTLTGSTPESDNDHYDIDGTTPFANDIWCVSDSVSPRTAFEWSTTTVYYGTPGYANDDCP